MANKSKIVQFASECFMIFYHNFVEYLPKTVTKIFQNTVFLQQ